MKREVTVKAIGASCIILLFIQPGLASAQDACKASTASVVIGLTGITSKPAKKPFHYPHIREADVMWSKRVWRTIDLREKINHRYYYPLTPVDGVKSLFDVLKCAILNGQITAYGNPLLDDQFQVPLTITEVQAMLMKIDSITTIDLSTERETVRQVTVETTAQDIKQYWVKEDWFFDRKRSVMDVRIVGICPLRESVSESGEVRGYQPMFWIYFPEARPVLARSIAFNPHNDGERPSFDELFARRMFGSYVHKESNEFDRSIPEYRTGIEALLESERIREELLLMEHDMWHY